MNNREKVSQYFERMQSAGQIRHARNQEKNQAQSEDFYKTHRTGQEYLVRMGGLEHLFEYVRSLKSRRVLDIGTGSGNALRMVSKMRIARALSFEATALNLSPELKRNLRKDQIHLTGVETLRGCKNYDFGAVLALNSVAYASYPRMAIKRINEVLVPGGVFKATFGDLGGIDNYGGQIMKGPDRFIEELAKAKYDLALTTHNFIGETKAEGEPETQIAPLGNTILLAIKPGGQSVSARELLKQDLSGAIKMSTKQIGGINLFSLDD